MFSIIICSIDLAKFAQMQQQYQQIFGSESYEVIGIHDARSLSEGYNRGVAAAKGEFFIFCHDDIEFVSPEDFLSRLINHLAKFDVIGLAGTTKLTHPMWLHAGPPYIFGQVAHVGGIPKWPEPYGVTIYSAPSACVSGIQALDGLFIAVQRRILDHVTFDEKTFEGFNCYDIDFTFSAYQAGFKLAVACDLPVIHQSRGKFDETWRNDAEKFLFKHVTRLSPIKNRQFRWTNVAAQNKEELKTLMLPPYVRSPL